MENNHNEVVRASQRNSCAKVHSAMCRELTMMLDKVSSILPSIEAARPGWKAGIQELCNLYNTVDKGKLIIQNCADCSRLYLAITGQATVSRCERVRDSLRQSLFLIQNMVPPMLANQIVDVHDDLQDVKFIVDSGEEEAGRAILELLRQSHPTDELELETFLRAAPKLNLTSPKAILIERRAIKKLLEKISGTDPKKEGILKYFLQLVKKYGKNIKPEVCEQNENLRAENGSLATSSSFSSDSGTPGKSLAPTNSERYEDQSNLSGAAVPPEEFCCPISSRLMSDPVIIASGQTYERECIERWFSEGYVTCPRTQVKLENFSVIPNTCMRDLICNWCKQHGFEVSEHVPPTKSEYNYLSEQLHGHSVSSLYDVSAPLIAGKAGDYVTDHSSMSFGSPDASYVSDSPHLRGMEEPRDSFGHFSWNADYQKYRTFRNFDQDMFLRLFYQLSEIPLELQGKAVKDFKEVLGGEKEVWCAAVSGSFVEAFIDFLKNCNGSCSVESQKAGVQFFLAFLADCRTKIPSISEVAFRVITSLLDSEFKAEALLMLYELIQHPNCRTPHVMTDVVAPRVLQLLETEDNECLELAFKIIRELSSDADLISYLVSSGIIPKLAPSLSAGSCTECCLEILRNLSEEEEAAVHITGANGCLGSLAEYLDTGSRKEKEHAVVTLHTICSRSSEDCALVMKEGVIPALVDLSVNGTEEGRDCSMKLLRLLRDLRRSDQLSNSCSWEVAVAEVVEKPPDPTVSKQPVSKSSRFFSRKLNIF